MKTVRRNSVKTRAIAKLMSFLLVIGSLMSFAAGGVNNAYAAPIPIPYSPPLEVAPAYKGPLTWTDFTAPIALDANPYEYYSPFFLDIDEDDNVYVTKFIADLSSSTGKVEKISDEGQTVTDITYNAALNFPLGIAVDKDGNVYVSDNSDYGNIDSDTNVARILMLPHGTNSWKDITHDEAMKVATGVAVDKQGNVYTIDGGFTDNESRILMLPNGESSWIDITGTPSPFLNPADIAVDGEGNVFVSDLSNSGSTGGKIYKRPAGGTAWTNVAPATDSGGLPFLAYGIHVDKFDNVYAMGLFHGKVMKLSYNKGPDDWTDIVPMSNPLYDFISYDVAADSSGYLYSPNMVYGNVTRLMATIIYNGNGHTGGTVPIDTHGYEPNVTAIVYGNTGNLEKANHVFDGWNTSPSVTGTTYAPGDTINMSQSITLYAIWKPIPSYTVSYQAAAGGSISGLANELVYSGSSPASVPTATPDPGYTFLGWSSDGGATLLTDAQLKSAIVTGDILYTAYFKPPVTVTGIVLDSVDYSLKKGATHQTVVTAEYSDLSKLAISSGVTYFSSNTAVATVDSSGLVTARANGQTVITVEFEGEQAQATVTVYSSSAKSSEPEQTTIAIEIIVDGVKQDQLATAKQDTVEGRSVVTVVLDNGKVIDKLEQDNSRLVSIPIRENSQVVVGQLNGSLVKAMESEDAQIQIVTEKAVYTLPAAQIDIDGISEQIGTDVKLEDILVSIQISEASDEKTAQAQAAAHRNQYEMLVHPVDFEISASYGSQTVQADQFNSYVGRMIALPEGVNTEDITTGVVLTANGELFHVPTIVVQQDGKTYARMNSLTNSTYSVIYNTSKMTDINGHWANADVNDMNARLIIQGVTATEFRPDAPITRAEFAAIVARGLGIQDIPYEGSFTDVGTDSWYAGTVQAAIHYKLFNGYEDGTFRPDQNISRQEAAAVLYRAMDIAELNLSLTAAEMNRVLSAFTDGSNTASWAQTSVAAAISINLIHGRDDKLDLDANLTRAEAAALVRRFLQEAKLINP